MKVTCVTRIAHIEKTEIEIGRATDNEIVWSGRSLEINQHGETFCYFRFL